MRFLFKRLITMVVTIRIIITLTFIIMHLIPGDPFVSDGISVPSFILAPLLIKYFSVQWGLLPIASWGTWSHSYCLQ